MLDAGETEHPRTRRLDRDQLAELATSVKNRFPHVSPDTLNVALGQLTNLGIAHFTVHDMRRTARTHLARMGIASDIAERALNHALQSTEGIYNQYDHFRERRMALTSWANYLHALEEGKTLPDGLEVDDEFVSGSSIDPSLSIQCCRQPDRGKALLYTT